MKSQKKCNHPVLVQWNQVKTLVRPDDNYICPECGAYFIVREYDLKTSKFKEASR